MDSESRCPRCGGPVTAPNAWTSAWRCAAHGDVDPLRPAGSPSRERLRALSRDARVPLWLPWPLPDAWLLAGCTGAGDERTGTRGCAMALSGPAPGGGPADLVIVAEEPGVGLGAGFAALDGPDPGTGFGVVSPHTRFRHGGHDFPLWHVPAGPDRAVYAGEALGTWLWAVVWPADAGVLLLDDLELRDLRDPGQWVDLPFGALSPRLSA